MNEIILYCLIVFLLLFLNAKISYKLNLIDRPNKRKIHSTVTVFTGGIALSIALIFSIFVTDISSHNLNLIFSIGFLISIVGFIDDKFDLNAGSKLSLQIIPIFYLIVIQNFYLIHLGDYHYFKIELGAFVLPFTLISILFLINAFNYFDGMDGTLSFTTISVLVILFFLNSNQDLQYFLIIILISLIIFLFFNFSIFKLPKMFLGDSGSLLIGFIVSFTLIHIANKNLIHPILLAWSIVIFVYEFLSINLIRLKNKKNLFRAGQDHLHHILFDKTKSIFLTNFFITLMNIILFTIGYLSFSLINPLVSLILYTFMFIIFFIFRCKYSKNEKKIKII